MYRKIEKNLEEWLKQKNKPIVLRGARQVGKSYLVRKIANNFKLDLHEINLEKIKLSELENNDTFSIEKVLDQISLFTKKKITNNSLIFLDEIQQQPKALNALRYFYEDRPELKVITAGSLLENTIYKEKFTMPVGRVRYLFLGPMSFCEFLEAINENILLEEINKLNTNFTSNKSLYDLASELLKIYYYTGGMPEAVKCYRDTKNMNAVREIHQDLILSYKDDIAKYSNKTEREIILSLFDYITNNLGEKVIFSKISKRNSTYIKEAIKLLEMSNVINVAKHTNCSGLPLAANKDDSIMKLYFLDIGLYNTLLNTSWEEISKLNSKELLIKGKLAEQFVAQHLKQEDFRENKELYYWQRNKSKGRAEVDFVISHNNIIYPLEVKSGKSGKMRSLWQLIYEKKLNSAVRLDLAFRKNMIEDINHDIKTKDGVQNINCKLTGIPLYAIERFNEFLT